jgi:digeranylgeranylglycerophospholipid reductase
MARGTQGAAPSSSRYDVIVVGAGPAGSTAARYAAHRGARVLMLEKRKTVGVPVQCGEYIAHNEEVSAIFPDVRDLPELMEVPYRWRQIDTPVLRLWSPRGRRWDIPFRGFTVCRDRMDQDLAAQAVDAGAELLTDTTCQAVVGDRVQTDRGTFQGTVVVGADGPRSRVARSAGLPWPVSAPAMSCLAEGEWSDATDLFFGSLAPGGYAWIIPKGDVANVGLGTWEAYEGSLKPLFEAFLDRLGVPRQRGVGGYVPVLGPVDRTVAGNVLLVGDAAGHVMATNGGGINVAMICGRIAGEVAAANALEGLSLDAYERRWRRMVGGPLETGVRIKRLADRFFGSDALLEWSMRLMGQRRMERAIRCRPLFLPSKPHRAEGRRPVSA